MTQSNLLKCPAPVLNYSNWGLTNFVKTFSHKWDIQQFMKLANKSGSLTEVEIPTHSQSRTSWYLQIYPRGTDDKFKDYVSVFLQSYQNTANAQYAIELLDSSNNVLVFRCCEFASFSVDSTHGFSDFIKRDTLEKALEKSSNGTLSVRCTINEFNCLPSGSGPRDSHSTCVLKTMLSDQIYTDFTINVKERQFKVHKSVLHVCSPVFAAMFSNEMLEREKNETTVDDVEPEIFEKLLEFIYTGDVDTMITVAMELVPVAHKYDLKALLQRCEAELCSQISIDMAVKLLILSNVYTLECLKSATIKYIKANLTEVSKTANWTSYVENDPKLLLLLLMHANDCN